MPKLPVTDRFSKKIFTAIKRVKVFLFGARKKLPEDELREIDEKKNDVVVRIDELQKEIEKFSEQMARVRIKEKEAIGLAQKSAVKESGAEDSSVRRAFELSRWEFQEKRRSHESEKWSIVESLRRMNTEIRTVRRELIQLESREGDLERSIEHRVLLPKHKKQQDVFKSSRTKTTSPVSEIAFAKKHILLRDLLMLSVRTFRVKLGMTMLTVLGIGVSFATVFFLVSLGYGLEKVLLDQFASETLMRSITVQSPNPDVIPLDKEVSAYISGLPGVEHVEPIYGLAGQIETTALAAEVQLHGTDPKYFSLSGGRIKDGRLYKSGERAVVLSSSFLLTMNKNSLSDFTQPLTVIAYRSTKTADGVKVEPVVLGSDFEVVGISDDEENSDVYLPSEYISNLVSQYRTLSVLTYRDDDVGELRTIISDKGFMSSSIIDTVDQAKKVFNIAEIILALFGSASIIVATIGMVNTMTVSLLERTQEIGIMKVLGVSDSDVRRLFLLEASIIGGLGGISGLIMGITFSEIFNFFINFLASNLGGQTVSLFYYPGWFVVTIVVSSFIIGFFTGIVPSQRAARMDPLNAVKYK